MEETFPILDNDILDIFIGANMGTDEGLPVISEGSDIASFSSSTTTEPVLTDIDGLLDSDGFTLPTTITSGSIPLQNISYTSISSTTTDTDSNLNDSSPQHNQEKIRNAIVLESKPIDDIRKPSALSPESTTPTIKNPTALLPPCRVCGEKASGFHYGANTCEPCKVCT